MSNGPPKALLDKIKEARGDSKAPSLKFNDAPLPTGPQALVADCIGLKKSWAKETGYWVELVYTPPTRLWTVIKRWSWYNSREKKWVKGDNRSSGMKSLPLVYEKFESAVADKLSQDYEIASRTSEMWGPFFFIDIKGSGQGDESVKSAQGAASTLGRKPKYDVW